jgi:hypothetical protein
VTDTTPPPAPQRPDPERLLGLEITATDDGGAQMTIQTRTPDGTFYEGILIMAPYVADGLRRAVLHAVPDRPQPKPTAAVLLQRMETWYTPIPAPAVRPPISPPTC